MRSTAVFSRFEAALAAAVALVGCGPPRAHGAAPMNRIAAAARASDARRIGVRVDGVAVVDDDHLWLLGEGRIWETRDRGRSFVDRTPFARPTGDGAEWRGAWSLLASASRVVVVRGAGDTARWMTLFVSEDGGSTFVARRVPRLEGGREATLQRGARPGSWLVLRSDGGGMNSHATSILETRDAGASWRALGTMTGYGAITFQTPTTWWSVGSCCASARSVYRSRDAGRTWSLVEGDESDAFDAESGILFIDPNVAQRFVRRDVGPLTLERSVDGARSFTPQPLPAGANAVVLAEGNVWALADDRGAVVTRDAGASWNHLPPFPTGSLAWSMARMPHGWLAVERRAEHDTALFFLTDGERAWRVATGHIGQ